MLKKARWRNQAEEIKLKKAEEIKLKESSWRKQDEEIKLKESSWRNQGEESKIKKIVSSMQSIQNDKMRCKHIQNVSRPCGDQLWDISVR